MDIEQQLIYIFSALGAFNGLLLSAYFLFFKGQKRLSDYFLGGLILMLSIRTIKSVFLHFNPHLFQLFIQIGLSACILIGPFLYLYVVSMTKEQHRLRKTWGLYILPFIALIVFLSIRYPYYENHNIWGPFIDLFYKLWLFCILAAGIHMTLLFKKVWKNRKSITTEEFWLLNIFFGVVFVYLGYDFSEYTSYIVGALSFSFVFYITVLLWLFKRNKKAIASDLPIKYANSGVSKEEASKLIESLDELMKNEKQYLDSELTLSKLSERLNVSRKSLSQAINQVKSQNYSKYIASLRVEEAKSMLAATDKKHHKISTIAYDSGFNSISSFNASFKEFVGVTAKEFRESLN